MASGSMKTVMRRGAIACGAAGIAVVAVALLSGPSSAGAGTEPGSFAFAIGNGTVTGSAQAVADRLGRFDLVVVDGEDMSAQAVDKLHGEGAQVLGYLSVGTIEKWRKWYPKVKKYRLSAWQDWKDEWYADTSKAGFRRKLANDIAPDLLDKGFDGLFLDNVDMVEVKKHRKQRKGMAQLVAMLDNLVDSQGALLFAQNGAPGVLHGYPQDDVDPLIDHFDGWNREDVSWTYDFDHRRYVANSNADRNEALDELDEIGDAGLTTTATDYVDLDDGDNDAECDSVTNANGVGALPYVADIGLTKKAVAANPPDC